MTLGPTLVLLEPRGGLDGASSMHKSEDWGNEVYRAPFMEGEGPAKTLSMLGSPGGSPK